MSLRVNKTSVCQVWIKRGKAAAAQKKESGSCSKEGERQLLQRRRAAAAPKQENGNCSKGERQLLQRRSSATQRRRAAAAPKQKSCSCYKGERQCIRTEIQQLDGVSMRADNFWWLIDCLNDSWPGVSMMRRPGSLSGFFSNSGTILHCSCITAIGTFVAPICCVIPPASPSW